MAALPLRRRPRPRYVTHAELSASLVPITRQASQITAIEASQQAGLALLAKRITALEALVGTQTSVVDESLEERVATLETLIS